jgi:MarR family transcriptional regulator for hemolysin
MLTLEEQFSVTLQGTARTWRQALDRRLKDLGMGQASWLAIAMIAKAGHPLSQTELAHKLGVEDPTVVSMLDRLEKSGYVAREPSPTDRRVKLVVLTEDGNAIFRKVKKEADAFRSGLLANIERSRLSDATALLQEIHAMIESAP